MEILPFAPPPIPHDRPLFEVLRFEQTCAGCAVKNCNEHHYLPVKHSSSPAFIKKGANLLQLAPTNIERQGVIQFLKAIPGYDTSNRDKLDKVIALKRATSATRGTMPCESYARTADSVSSVAML